MFRSAIHHLVIKINWNAFYLWKMWKHTIFTCCAALFLRLKKQGILYKLISQIKVFVSLNSAGNFIWVALFMTYDLWLIHWIDGDRGCPLVGLHFTCNKCKQMILIGTPKIAVQIMATMMFVIEQLNNKGKSTSRQRKIALQTNSSERSRFLFSVNISCLSGLESFIQQQTIILFSAQSALNSVSPHYRSAAIDTSRCFVVTVAVYCRVISVLFFFVVDAIFVIILIINHLAYASQW